MVFACGEDFEPIGGTQDAGIDGSAGDTSSVGGAAGAGGAGAMAGSAGASGADAAAGASGTGQVGCETLNAPFPVLTPSDLTATQKLDDTLALVKYEAAPSVHVAAMAVDTGGNYELLARTIGDNGKLSAVAKWQSAEPGPLFDTGTAISSEVSFFGIDGPQLKKITFPTDAFGITGAQPIATPLPTPAVCESSGQKLGGARFAFASASDYRVALTCSDGTQNKLFIGGSAVSFEEVDSGGDQDGTVNVGDYVYSGNVHLIQNDGSVYRYGTNAAQLATPHQLSLSTETDVSTVGLTIIGLKSPAEGSVVLAATFKDGPAVSAQLHAATLSNGQYGDLGTTKPASFKQLFSATKLDEAPVFREGNWSVDANTIVTPATTFTGDRVRFWMFDRSGAPLVMNYDVAALPAGTTIVAAHAAQLGFSQIVVWMTEDGTGKRTVMAQRLVCAAE